MSHTITGIVLFLAAVLAAPTLYAAVSVESAPTAGVVVKIESGGAPTTARSDIMIEPHGAGILIEPHGIDARSDHLAATAIRIGARYHGCPVGQETPHLSPSGGTR